MATINNILLKILKILKNFKNHYVVSGKIGKNTKIEKNTIIDQESKVGKECYINTNCVITKANIGNYCSIGSNVIVGPGEHDFTKFSTSSKVYGSGYDDLTKKPCTIGNDVWIGTYAIIKRGVHIGNGAVIGANSVVTKDVPDFAIVAGVPSKVLKYRFDIETQKRIVDSNWWEYDIAEAVKILKQLEKNAKKNNFTDNQ